MGKHEIIVPHHVPANERDDDGFDTEGCYFPPESGFENPKKGSPGPIQRFLKSLFRSDDSWNRQLNKTRLRKLRKAVRECPLEIYEQRELEERCDDLGED